MFYTLFILVFQAIQEDEAFQQAVRTSYGKRPIVSFAKN